MLYMCIYRKAPLIGRLIQMYFCYLGVQLYNIPTIQTCLFMVCNIYHSYRGSISSTINDSSYKRAVERSTGQNPLSELL